ncbi:MAG: helix-turn-helix domain-containing protein [Pontixanthobacter sp.]
MTKDGVPLALNRPPAPDLEPWLGRVMVAIADAPAEAVNNGWLCNDAAYIRTAIGVDWSVETADGRLDIRDDTFLCGQHSKSMPLRYVGGIKVSGVMLRPGSINALWGIEDGSLIDRIIPQFERCEITTLYKQGVSPEAWLLAIEDWFRYYISRHGIAPPDRLSQKFEVACFADPNQSITDFADENGVTARTLQRIIKRDFGLTPKQVMRRARTLDLAARLCGVADENEEEEIYLRFFDQSHQIREFIAFFDKTPREFLKSRNSLLTLSLEIRQARRLEMLNRIAPDAIRPWMQEEFVPAMASA